MPVRPGGNMMVAWRRKPGKESKVCDDWSEPIEKARGVFAGFLTPHACFYPNSFPVLGRMSCVSSGA